MVVRRTVTGDSLFGRVAFLVVWEDASRMFQECVTGQEARSARVTYMAQIDKRIGLRQDSIRHADRAAFVTRLSCFPSDRKRAR
jgi:hypothetical protein